ncbi:hypothetical protein IW261DRAFT_1649349, partial [Armillaria novae-zelandiae]
LNAYLPTGSASSWSSSTFSVPTTTSSDGSRDIPGSTADAGGRLTGSYMGASSMDGSGKSGTYALTSTSGGVLSTTQANRHSSSSSFTSSGSLSANTMSVPLSRPSALLHPTPTTTSEPISASSDSNPIINMATHRGGATSTSTSSLENPIITDNGFLPSTSVNQNSGISSGAVATILAIDGSGGLPIYIIARAQDGVRLLAQEVDLMMFPLLSPPM